MDSLLLTIIRLGCAGMFIIFAGSALSGWLLGVADKWRANRDNAAARRGVLDTIYGGALDADDDEFYQYLPSLDSRHLSSDSDDNGYHPLDLDPSAWQTTIDVKGTTAEIHMTRGKQKRGAIIQVIGDMIVISHITPTTGMPRYSLELYAEDMMEALRRIGENIDE